GDDVYEMKAKDAKPGTAVFDPRLLDRSGATPLYWTESRSIGLFVDGGGRDRYPAGASDGDAWTDARESDNARARNVGVRRAAKSSSRPPRRTSTRWTSSSASTKWRGRPPSRPPRTSSRSGST